MLASAASGTAPASTDSAFGSSRKNRRLRIDRKFVLFPINSESSSGRVRLVKNGRVLRSFTASLGLPAQWWAHLDVSAWQGQTLTLSIEPDNALAVIAGMKSAGRGAGETDNAELVAAVRTSPEIWSPETLYKEPLRPQFHFSSRRGRLNDPHLVFYRGEYHLYYQHNPYGWNWGNGHWGHAVSTDLVHWKELPIALYPDENCIMQSGSIVVDWNNTAGFRHGDEQAMVALYTTRGRQIISGNQVINENDIPATQGVAYSNDRGRTWTHYENNPVIPHIVGGNRDPKVFWHAPENKWVMALYMDKSDFAFFSSTDLKHWQKTGELTLEGDTECPELFELAVDEDPGNTRWIFYAAKGLYLIGTFDGKTFKSESGPHEMQHGNCWYASQTFSDIPAADGRRILIAWGPASSAYEGMPFNQAMSIPVALTLRTTDVGLRLLCNPVKELASLRSKSHSIKPQILRDKNPLADLNGELFELEAQVTLGDAKEIVFDLRGVPVTYDTQKQELSCADRKTSLQPEGGTIRLRALIDRTSIDIFGNDGRVYMPMGMVVPADNRSLQVYAKGGKARIDSLEVFELNSAWVNTG